jgi:hypothetical protein
MNSLAAACAEVQRPLAALRESLCAADARDTASIDRFAATMQKAVIRLRDAWAGSSPADRHAQLGPLQACMAQIQALTESVLRAQATNHRGLQAVLPQAAGAGVVYDAAGRKAAAYSAGSLQA